MTSSHFRDPLTVVAFAFVMALNWLLIYRHDNWMDELQALIIAREIKSFTGLWEVMRYEGHPPLWHLLLKLALYFNDDVAVLRQSQFLFAFLIQALVFFACPFPLLARVMIGTSFYILYEYGVISRGYTLGMIFLFGYAALQASRWRYLPLTLMPLIAMPFAILSAGFLFWEFWRGERRLLPFASWALVAAVTATFLMPQADYVSPSSSMSDYQSSYAVRGILTAFALSSAILPFDPTRAPIVWEGRVPLPELATLIGFLVPFVVYAALRKTPLLLLAVIGLIVVSIAVSMKVTLLGNRHFGLVAMAVIACEWLRYKQTGALSRVTSVWLAMLSVSGLWAAYFAAQVPMTEGRAIAAFIKERGMLDKTIVAHPTLIGTFFSAYHRQPFTSLTGQCATTFVRWNHDSARRMTHEEIRASIASNAGGKTGPVYLLVQKRVGEDIEIQEMPEAKRIASFTKGMVFPVEIYEFPDQKRAAAPLPPKCA